MTRGRIVMRVFSLIVVLAAPSSAVAQECLGGLRLAGMPVQVGLARIVSVKSTATRVNVAAGEQVVFAEGSFEVRERIDTQRTAREFRARVGRTFAPTESNRLSSCATGEFSYRRFAGRDWGSLGGSLTGFDAGMFFGYRLAQVGAVRLLSTVGIAAGIATDTSRVGGGGSALDGYGRFGLGVMYKRLSVAAVTLLPAATDIPEPSFGVGVTLGIPK
jgi:hypothetical protein